MIGRPQKKMEKHGMGGAMTSMLFFLAMDTGHKIFTKAPGYPHNSPGEATISGHPHNYHNILFPPTTSTQSNNRKETHNSTDRHHEYRQYPQYRKEPLGDNKNHAVNKEVVDSLLNQIFRRWGNRFIRRGKQRAEMERQWMGKRRQ